MNRCRFIKELDSYLDNQLSEIKKLRIEEHLRKCKTCNEELAALRALSEKLKSWPAPVLKPTFDSCVKNKIVALELAKEGVKMKKKTLSILIPSGAIAGILIVSLLSFQMYVKSGMRGRFKSGPDSLGEQYEADSVYNRFTNSGNIVAGQKKLANARHGGKVKEQLAKNAIETGFWGSDSKRERYIRSGEEKGVYNVAAKLGSVGIVDNISPMPPAKSSISKSIGNISVLGEEDARVIVIQPTLQATGIGDMIIRTAELTLEVENGKETYRKIADICREFGGYQAESSFSKNDQGREAGRVTLRIPKDKFLNALDKLSELGKVKANNTYSQDVRQDYANLKAELDAAMVVYSKMLEALQKRQTSIPEAIRLESELTPVLKKIENLKNEIERLNNLTSFTTITVNFYEAEVSAKVLEETKKLVKENMLAAKINAVRYFATHLPLVGFVAGFTIAVFTLLILLSIFITRLKKRG